jgi:hypothetical protein
MQALMAIRQFDRPDYLSVSIDSACATQCLGCCRFCQNERRRIKLDIV